MTVERRKKTDHDVKAMQSDQRVVGGSEQVGADRQSFLIDEPVPFAAGSVKKGRTQRMVSNHQAPKRSDVTPAQRSGGEVNRQAAREQTDRVKDRDTENVFRHGSRQSSCRYKRGTRRQRS